MPLYATNVGPGPMEYYGIGNFLPGMRKLVSAEAAARLYDAENFRVSADDPSDFAFRRADGRVGYVGYTGPIDSTFGYGGGGLTIMRALARLGAQARVNWRYGSSPVNTTDLPDDARRAIASDPDWTPLWEILHAPPQYWRLARSQRRIGWTMWETDAIPGTPENRGKVDWTTEWKLADRLVVPCEHNKELFARAGFTGPIEVIPYGLDTEVWPYFERPGRDVFTFTLFGQLTSRKGTQEAIAAFWKAFPTETDVRFELKTQRGIFCGQGIPEFKDRRIVVHDATWSRQQLVDYLHRGDAFVWLSRGEGFGLPPLQAALTGLPVIMTTHTGMGAYYDPRYFYGVKDAGFSPAVQMGGRWIEPDVDDAARLMREVYEDRKAARERGKKAAAYVRRNFSLGAFANRLGAYLEALPE